MDYKIEIKTTAAESFTCVYNYLDKVGLSGFLLKPKTKFLNVCYQLYRLLANTWVFYYTTQHITFAVLAWGDMDKVLEGATYAFIHMNCAVKCVVLNLGTSRLRKVFDVLNDPIFDADNENDAKLLTKNKQFAHNMEKTFLKLISVMGVLWFLVFILNKLHDDNTFIPSHFPFETRSWKGYVLGAFMETGSVIWTGNGHISLDVLVATYYAQARTQLQIIRHNLENVYSAQSQIFDQDQSSEQADIRNRVTKQYIDDLDENVQARFVRCVKRYEKVVWYANEVSEIFSIAILFQFFSLAMPICFIVIKLSSISIATAEFLFLFVVVWILLSQVFLYCLFGELVLHESSLITDSMYLSQWESLSPKFRRQILIAAERWRSPIEPRVAYVIPLCLDTFISIVKSVYTLFTVLKTTQIG